MGCFLQKTKLKKINKGGGTCKHATILLTGTINPLSFNRNTSKEKINVFLDNALERLAQYENAIVKYITESYFTDIVFVENSGYHFPAEKYIKLAEEHGKRFEFLYRELSDDEVATMQDRGKGWGEADLIDYAMRNSRLIAQTDTIYKITGRVFLENSKQIIKKARNESEFIANPKKKWIQTYFFKIKREDYFTYLQKAINMVNDRENKQIEQIYYSIMSAEKIETRCFKVYPRVTGQYGSINRTYGKSRLQYFIRDVLLMFGSSRWEIKN